MTSLSVCILWISLSRIISPPVWLIILNDLMSQKYGLLLLKKIGLIFELDIFEKRFSYFTGSNSIIKMTKSRRINSQQQIKSLNAVSEEIATINKRTPAVNKLQDSETLRNSTTIPLSNGGTVVVDGAVNLFSLSEEDRSFVFSIVDLAKSYTSSK